MEAKELILRSLDESQGFLAKALDGLTQEEVAWVPKAESNSIAFILWHVIRVEDIWVNRVIQRQDEVYETGNWQERLGTPPKESGYRYTREQLQTWPVPELELLRRYASSVREKTLNLLRSLTPEKLSEVARTDLTTDTVGAILGHLITEIALHVGQINYLRGLQRGLDSPDQRYW
jgi:uncharacterized damage-inducible protein DinB